MKVDNFIDHESQFIRQIDKFEFVSQNAEASQARLDEWRDSLMKALMTGRSTQDGLKKSSKLSQKVTAVNDAVQASIKAWTQHWESRAPARELAEQFGDKSVLLVFGKVNAGKSSFCNFITDRFIANGKTAQYFYLQDGRVVETQERFKEGITETTARIQGVFLDRNLVLLDTPGLHSVTEENGELTKRFTDSADGVLWLTSSSSPGQVQELEELQIELRSGKPLLPVITKSDRPEEDEIDGEIIKTLLNKDAENRSEQELDVNKRTVEKIKKSGLDVALLRTPVSVSVHMAKTQEQTPQAMLDAGFEQFYGEITKIVHDALAYKRHKVEAMFINHLDKDVLGALNSQVLPRLDELKQASANAQENLKRQQPQITSAAMREVLSALPGLLEKHQESRDAKAVCNALSTLSHEALGKEIKNALADYVVTLDDSLGKISPSENVGFEERTIEVEVRKGAAGRAATGALGAGAGGWAGAEAGAALGTMLFPGVGTVIGGFAGAVFGGLLGGWFGGKGGEVFEGTEIQRRLVGVSYEKLLSSLDADVRQKLPELSAYVVEQCLASIRLVNKDVARLDDIIREREQGLVQLKKELGNESI